jgi:hypothetical protein
MGKDILKVILLNTYNPHEMGIDHWKVSSFTTTFYTGPSLTKPGLQITNLQAH